jgi:hypothetical protein
MSSPGGHPLKGDNFKSNIGILPEHNNSYPAGPACQFRVYVNVTNSLKSFFFFDEVLETWNKAQSKRMDREVYLIPWIKFLDISFGAFWFGRLNDGESERRGFFASANRPTATPMLHSCYM